VAVPTWHERELPALEALAALEETRENGSSLDEVAELAGLPRARAVIAVEALIDSGHVAGHPAHDMAGKDWLALRLLAPGRRAVRQWPSDDLTADALVDVLEQRIAQEDDPDERGRLERMRDAARNLGGAALREVTVAWARQVLGPS
jgi:hypothetical protein